MRSNIYSALWTDPAFYMAAGVFALALFLLVFSIRKYLEIKNASDFEEPGAEAEEVQGELPLAAAEAAETAETPSAAVSATDDLDKTLVASPEPFSPPAEVSRPDPAPASETVQPHASSKAEEFVKGLYQNISSLDERMKNIEAAFSKKSVNRDFAVTFLEDIISDYDSLDKDKIKARIEYLVSDLKK